MARCIWFELVSKEKGQGEITIRSSIPCYNNSVVTTGGGLFSKAKKSKCIHY